MFYYQIINSPAKCSVNVLFVLENHIILWSGQFSVRTFLSEICTAGQFLVSWLICRAGISQLLVLQGRAILSPDICPLVDL